jgi:chromatin remodeling complex protein RSC6
MATEENDTMECSAECNMTCNMGVNNDDAVIAQQFSELLMAIGSVKGVLSNLQQQVKVIERNTRKRAKKLARDRKPRRRNSNKPSGFALPTSISDELCTFMNKEKNELVARTDVTRYIIKYVKENALQNKENGQIIEPNAELKTLLNVGDEDKLTYFNIQKFMNPHFHKSAKSD